MLHPQTATLATNQAVDPNTSEVEATSEDPVTSAESPLDFDPLSIDDDFSIFIKTGRWGNQPEINKTIEEKKDTRSPEELKKLEKLKELEHSKKKEKVEELQKEIDRIKTQTPRLFKDLIDKIEKLITQIERETDTVSSVLEKQSITISEIITKIEDPEIYKSFEQHKDQNPEFYKNFLKNPIREIITKILTDDPKIDEEFKRLFEDNPDLITKIITPIVKENAIKKIITQIAEEVSEDSQVLEGVLTDPQEALEKSEKNKYDSFRKIIDKILEKEALITRYYIKDSSSIVEIIDQLQSEKADEKTVEDRIKKISTQILEEKEKALQAITQDPLGQIIIEHKIEKANSPQKEEADTKKIVVKGQEVKTQIYSNINQEIVEQILFKDEAELPITKSVKKEILDAYQDRSKIENESKKTTFLSKFSAKILQKKRNTILVSSDSGIESDMVFVKLEEKLDFTQAEEKLAKTEKRGEDLDVKKLLIYAELIAKIPQEYSESISPTHQEIIYLKKQEKGHKKTLNFLKELIENEEKIIAEKKRIAKEITQIEKIVEEITKEITKEIAEAKKLYLAEQERIDAEKIAETSVKKIRGDFEVLIKEAKKLTLEEQKIQISRTLTANSNSLIQAKKDIYKKVREILSSEYVDEKLANGPEESTMKQLLIEAIIVDEAKNKLTLEETKEIESKLKPESPDSTSSEIDKKALNLLIIQKALEKILTSEQKEMGLDEEINIDVTAINTVQNRLNFLKPNNQLNLDALALLELKEQSRALEERLTEINIELEKQSKALEERLAEINALLEIATPASELSSPKPENALGVVEKPSDEMKPFNDESSVKPRIMEGENRSSNPPDDPLSAGGDFAQVQVKKEIPSLPEKSNLGLPSSENGDQLELDPQIAKKSRKLRSAQEKYEDPSQHANQEASTPVPALSLGNMGPYTAPSTQLSTRTEKNEFWRSFISTRLTTSAQNSPRNDDFTQPESENLSALPTPRSTLSDSQQEEIEKRKKGLYAILKDILENQSPIKSESGSKDEEIYIEEGDKEVAKNNLEDVMAHIANYTLNLLLSISQTEGTLSSEALETQTTQNSSNDDPIIYSGIGIRIKLEKEGENLSLKITEVFENSGLEKEAVNKKITHVKCGNDFKSIGEIHRECGGDEQKFYNKISVIFRDEKQEKLTLKIEGEEQERTVVKNIFIPEDKKCLNIYDNSQMTQIADKLRASRQISSQLTTPRKSTQTA